MHSGCPESETELAGFGGRCELRGCGPLSPSWPEKKRKSQSQITYMSPLSKPSHFDAPPNLWLVTETRNKHTTPLTVVLALPFLSQGHQYFCQSWGLQIWFSPYQRSVVSSHPSPMFSGQACFTDSVRPLWEARCPASFTVLCSWMSTTQSGFPLTHFIKVSV